MSLSQWNLELLNQHAQRSYPLTDDSTKKDTSGSFTIPDDFLVGMDIPVSTAMDMATGRFFIRQLGLFASGIQIVVAYDTGSTVVDVGSALVPVSGFTRNKVFALGGISPFDDTFGKVVIGKISTILEQPAGLFTFDIDGARLEPQVVRPMIRGITAFRIANAEGNLSENMYGDIELVAGSNMQLSAAVGLSSARITLSAISGSGTVQACVCEGDAVDLPCIKTINGISATPDGNFNFIGDDCLSFDGIANGLKVTDSCCKPCCGCPELEAITRDLERFNSERAALNIFVGQLSAQNTVFNTTVLGARLGDRNCLAGA
jgi:hypothetical protein